MGYPTVQLTSTGDAVHGSEYSADLLESCAMGQNQVVSQDNADPSECANHGAIQAGPGLAICSVKSKRASATGI